MMKSKQKVLEYYLILEANEQTKQNTLPTRLNLTMDDEQQESHKRIRFHTFYHNDC